MQTPSQGSNKSLAIVAEAVAGWFGFLGVGHFILGNRDTGFKLLIGWWIGVIIMLAAAIGTVGAGLACIGPIWFVVPILSAIALATSS